MPRIEIRMERDFKAFSTADKSNFLESLSNLTGASTPELERGEFRSGCVIYTTLLTIEQAQKLLAFVVRLGVKKKLLESSGSEALENRQYKDFVAENGVSSIRNLDQDKNISTSKTASDGPMIVFLHGWSSSPAAFGKLPKRVKDSTGLNTVCLKYPTGKLGGYPGLISIAQYLDNEISVRTGRSRDLAFIAHSMGGLLARRLIVGSVDGTALVEKSVRQLTLIASPSVGSTLATVANIATLFSQRQLADLSKDSSFLQDLGPRWTSWMRRNVPSNARVRAIYGEYDSVVPRAEAMLFDERPVPVLSGDHSTVVNPKDEEDQFRLLATITKFLNEAHIA